MTVKDGLNLLWLILWIIWAIVIVTFWCTGENKWNIAQFILMFGFWIPIIIRSILPNKILNRKLWKK